MALRCAAVVEKSNCSDDFDFHQRVLGKARDLYGGARGRRGGEITSVDFVHSSEVVHVLEKHGGLDDVMEVGAAGLKDSFDVFENALGLLTNFRAGHFASLGVERNLPG